MPEARSSANGSGVEKRICDQVEYYFGDINLPRDRFLQEEMKKDCGWVPLETMLKFNRLASITTDVKAIAEALGNSELIEVSDDKTKIRRDPEVPLPENTLEYWQEIKKRTVYVKGFPLDTTLDEVLSFAGSIGDVQNALMRRIRNKDKAEPRSFKGSVFVTYKDKETAERLVKDESKEASEFKGNSLVKMMQDDYWTAKREEAKKQRDEAKALKAEKKKQVAEEQQKKIEEQQKKQTTHFVKGCVLKVEGFSDPTKLTGAEITKVKDFFRPYGEVAFLIVEDSGTVKMRLQATKEGQGALFWEKALAACGSDGKVKYTEEQLLSAEPLSGEEEQEYWAKFTSAKADKLRKRDEHGKKGAGKKGRDGRKGKWDGKRARMDSDQSKTGKRQAGDQPEAESPKKAKRTVFEDEEENGNGDHAENSEEQGNA